MDKGKRGRKRKSPAPEANAPVPKVARMSETQAAEAEPKAPVARMR